MPNARSILQPVASQLAAVIPEAIVLDLLVELVSRPALFKIVSVAQTEVVVNDIAIDDPQVTHRVRIINAHGANHREGVIVGLYDDGIFVYGVDQGVAWRVRASINDIRWRIDSEGVGGWDVSESDVVTIL